MDKKNITHNTNQWDVHDFNRKRFSWRLFFSHKQACRGTYTLTDTLTD